jgi:hypothetical protein
MGGRRLNVDSWTCMQHWLIRIQGISRKEVDIALLTQAVIALGTQLKQESQQDACDETSSQIATRREEP